jgi:hypothetical protein
MERYDKKYFQIAFNDFTFDRSEYNKEAKQPFCSTEQMKSNIKSIFIKIPLEVLLTPLLKIYAKMPIFFINIHENANNKHWKF